MNELTPLVDRVRAELASEPSLREVQMFGGLSFIVNEKMVVAVRNSDLLVRVDPQRHDALVARPDAATATTPHCSAKPRSPRRLLREWMVGGSGEVFERLVDLLAESAHAGMSEGDSSAPVRGSDVVRVGHDAGFLVQLTNRGLYLCFVGLDPAAGQLPHRPLVRMHRFSDLEQEDPPGKVEDLEPYCAALVHGKVHPATCRCGRGGCNTASRHGLCVGLRIACARPPRALAG